MAEPPRYGGEGDRGCGPPRRPPLCSARCQVLAAGLLATALGVSSWLGAGPRRPRAAAVVAGLGGRTGLSEAADRAAWSPILVAIVLARDAGSDAGKWCVGMSGGASAAVKTSHLELVSCSDDPLVFSVPTANHSHMSVSGRGAPGLCLDNPGDTELQLWSCDDTNAEAQKNMEFFLTSDQANQTEGTIRPLKNPSMCMSVSRAEVGAPVEMQACKCTTCRESFMLKIMNGAGPEVASAVRLLKHMRSQTPELRHGAMG